MIVITFGHLCVHLTYGPRQRQGLCSGPASYACLVLDTALVGNGLHMTFAFVFLVPALILIMWSIYSVSVLNRLTHRL